VVDWDGLENRCALTGTVGSNPTLSANFHDIAAPERPRHRMAYKEPSFQDRAALSAQAKQKALEKLKAKPPIDPAVAEARAAARAAKEVADAKRRADKLAAAEQAKLDKVARAEAALAEAAAAVERAHLTEAEKKAARDARYAARKKGKR
jgi:hypothetical protein